MLSGVSSARDTSEPLHTSHTSGTAGRWEIRL
jgi:hypothetical protein